MNNNNASSQRIPTDIPVETPPGPPVAHPSAHALSPVWSVSPNYNGSILYDSFELQAVTKQINKALQGPNRPLSPYSYYLKSPFYRQRLDRIYRENAQTPKRLTSRRAESGSVDTKAGVRSNASRGNTRTGFVIRLWKKVKRGLMWNKHRQED